MTTLSNPIQPFAIGWNPPNPQAVRWGLDTLVEQNRRNPAPEAEQRNEPRYSIAELNDMDIDTLARRFARQRYDRRPPVVKALDLIDLPRNVVANVVFPGTAAAQGREGERGAFGLPRVNFSDALRHMGVENKLARGLVGFAGDVLLDPLTYLGGTGAGLRLGSAKGGEVVLSRTGRKVLNRSVREAAQGGFRNIADDAAREWFRFRGIDDAALARFASEAAAAGEDVAKGVESRVRTLALGDSVRPRVGKILTPLGFDSRIGQSPIADAFTAAVDNTSPASVLQGREAAQGLVRRYMRGSTELPSLFTTKAAREAGVGVDWLHIPGTDISLLKTGAIGPIGRESAGLARMARAGTAAPLRTELIDAAQGAARASAAGSEDLTNLLQTLGDSRAAMREAGVMPSVWEDADGVIQYAPPAFEPVTEQVLRQMRLTAETVKQQQLATADLVNKATKSIPVEKLTPEVMLANVKMAREAEAEISLANASLAEANEAWRVVSPLRAQRIEAVRGRAAQMLSERRWFWQEDYDELDTLWRTYDGELTDIQQRLFDLSDNEFGQFENYVTTLQDRIAANRMLREAALKPVYAGLTSDERTVVDVAKRLLGTTSDVQGLQVVGPISNALGNMLGEDAKVVRWIDLLAKHGRTAFGVKSGSLYHQFRRLRAVSGMGFKASVEGLAASRRDAIRDAVTGLIDSKEFVKDFGKIDELITSVAGAKLAERYPELAFRPWKFDPAAPGGIAVDELGQPIPNPWMETIIKARKSGYLNEKMYPGLSKKIDELAGQDIENFRQLAAQGEDDLDLIAREVYLPNMISDEARDAILTGKAAGPDRNVQIATGKSRMEKVEAFQKARTSDEYVYPVLDEAGNPTEWRMFHGWDRAYLTDQYSDAQLAKVFGAESDEAKRIRAVKQAINDYDNADELFKAKYPPRPMHPADLNQLALDGKLEMLLSRADIRHSAFEVGSSRIWAKRVAQQQRANARQAFKDIMGDHGFLIPQDALQAAKNGSGPFNIGGVEARMLQVGDDAAPTIIKVGDQRFRSLNPQAIDGDGLVLASGLFDGTTVDGAVAIFPERAAELIERAFGAFRAPGSLANFLRAMDKLTGYWKVTTLFHPSWTIGNIMGDGLLAASTGARPDQIARNFRDASRIVFARGGKGLDRVYTFGGEAKTAEEWLANAVEHGFLKANLTSDTVETLVREGHISLTDNRAFSAAGVRDRWADAERVISQSEKLDKLPNGAKKLGQTSVFMGKQMASMTGAWFKANSALSDAMRLATYFALREAGHSDEQAARLIIQNMLDYGDLTNFEQNVLKRLLPFYSWLSGSMKQQIGFALDHPWYAGMAPKVKSALEESYLGDARVPEHERPAWLREQLAIQVGADPNSRSAFTIGSLLPSEQLYRSMAGTIGIEGAMDYANFMLAGLNPLARVPLELALGREFFSDRQIGPDQYSGEVSALEHIAGQVRPLREFYNPFSVRRGAIVSAFDRSVGEGVGRALIGGRLQPFNDERIAFNNRRELDEKVQNIRRAIRIAVREGDAPASLRARLELMRVYDAALQLGYSDAVPKWAQRQLAELNGASEAE